MQRRLLQPRSQTRRWRFPQPGLVRSTIPLVCTRLRPRADFPRVCVFTASLSLFVDLPHIYACQRPIDFPHVHADTHSHALFVCAGQRPRGRPPSCSRRHSQPPPPFPAPRLCTLTYEGSTMFAPAFTTGFPRVYTPTHEGLFPLCLHRCSQLRPPLQSQVRFGPISRLLGSVHPDG